MWSHAEYHHISQQRSATTLSHPIPYRFSWSPLSKPSPASRPIHNASGPVPLGSSESGKPLMLLHVYFAGVPCRVCACSHTTPPARLAFRCYSTGVAFIRVDPSSHLLSAPVMDLPARLKLSQANDYPQRRRSGAGSPAKTIKEASCRPLPFPSSPELPVLRADAKRACIIILEASGFDFLYKKRAGFFCVFVADRDPRSSTTSQHTTSLDRSTLLSIRAPPAAMHQAPLGGE